MLWCCYCYFCQLKGRGIRDKLIQIGLKLCRLQEEIRFDCEISHIAPQASNMSNLHKLKAIFKQILDTFDGKCSDETKENVEHVESAMRQVAKQSYGDKKVEIYRNFL